MNEPKLPVTEIRLSGIGKKFNDRWIFNGVNFQINKNDRIALIGKNGSGKSTLLQIIAGYISPSAGDIAWKNSTGFIETDQVFRHLSFAGPYMDLIEQFTLSENIDFFCKMKPLLPGISSKDMLQISGLEQSAAIQVQNFSSGMKQKVKLTMAFLANSSMLLLDEPLSNLDDTGYEWYNNMSQQYLNDRILLVCSNQVKEEVAFCRSTFRIENFK